MIITLIIISWAVVGALSVIVLHKTIKEDVKISDLIVSMISGGIFAFFTVIYLLLKLFLIIKEYTDRFEDKPIIKFKKNGKKKSIHID